MDELVRWLGEQLSLDAAQATEAGEELGPNWDYDDGFVLARREGDMVATGSQDFLEAERGRFIAAHDPARVLAEIDAKRQMITDVAAASASALDMEHGCCHEPPQILAGECPQFAPRDLPLLRLLALPYASRPGYQESWRP
jgi:hypothetical protein